MSYYVEFGFPLNFLAALVLQLVLSLRFLILQLHKVMLNPIIVSSISIYVELPMNTEFSVSSPIVFPNAGRSPHAAS